MNKVLKKSPIGQIGTWAIKLLKRRFTIRETLVISFIYFGIVTAVFTVLFFYPYQQSVDTLKSKHKRLNKQHDTVQQTLVRLTEASQKNETDQIKEDVLRPHTYLQPAKNHYLTTLLAMFQQHHLSLVKSKIPQPQQTDGPFETSKMQVVLEGQYSDLGNFLFTLKDVPILTQYKFVELEPIPDSYLNRMSLEMDVYTYKPPEVKL